MGRHMRRTASRDAPASRERASASSKTSRYRSTSDSSSPGTSPRRDPRCRRGRTLDHRGISSIMKWPDVGPAQTRGERQHPDDDVRQLHEVQEVPHLRRHHLRPADRRERAPTRRRRQSAASGSAPSEPVLAPHAQLDELLDLLRRVVGQLRRQDGPRVVGGLQQAVQDRRGRTTAAPRRRSPARRSGRGASRKNRSGCDPVRVRLPPPLRPALPHQPQEHLPLGVRR